MKGAAPAGTQNRRRSSTPHYQTFPTPPPRSRGKPPASPSQCSGGEFSSALHQDGCRGPNEQRNNSPPPERQLAMLAVLALAEQTALNSIPPYLPEMVSTFPEVDEARVGLYVGMIASTFALAQFATGFFWGWLSERIGRKPVVMLGTLLTAGCFCAFGLCRTFGQALVVQALMGLVNGNPATISTFLGEITDKTDHDTAFDYLPVLYGIGGIIGPAAGGLLVMHQDPLSDGQKNPYPYLLPNLFAASILTIDLILSAFFLAESLEEVEDLPPLKKKVKSLFALMWQSIGGAGPPTDLRWHHRDPQQRPDDVGDVNSDDESTEPDESRTQSLLSMPELSPHTSIAGWASKEVLNRNTILLLSTYLLFQLSNNSFNSLFPIYSSASPPTGRGLSPKEIGLSLSLLGTVTVLSHVGIFSKLKVKLANKATYSAGLFGIFLAMVMMPWLSYPDSHAPFLGGSGRVWLWVEIGFVLLVKAIATVGGLASALYMITRSAPSHAAFVTLNGLAQAVSTTGRVVGPFLSGSLFSISTTIQPKGEVLAWGVFGGIALVGFLASFGISPDSSESERWNEEEGMTEDADEEEEDRAGHAGWR